MVISKLKCVACEYDHKKSKNDENKVSLHKFPEDDRIRKIWIKNLEISKEVGNHLNARVCSQHFFNNYFKENGYLVFHATAILDIKYVQKLNNVQNNPTGVCPTYDAINTSTDSYSSINSSQRSFNKSDKSEVEVEERISLYWKIGIVIVLLAILVPVLMLFFQKSESLAKEESLKTCPEFLQLRETFKNQDNDIWKLLKVGTEGVLNKNPPSPGCYIFAAEDKTLLDQVISAIVETTANCLNSSPKPIMLKSNDLASEKYLDDNSKIVNDFKPKLSESGILAIMDFNRVPIEVLPAFHSFCDTYNPLVHKAIIILSMQVSRIPANHRNPSQFMNEYLQDRWGSLPDNIRGPLITRVTENSFILVKE